MKIADYWHKLAIRVSADGISKSALIHSLKSSVKSKLNHELLIQRKHIYYNSFANVLITAVDFFV